VGGRRGERGREVWGSGGWGAPRGGGKRRTGGGGLSIVRMRPGVGRGVGRWVWEVSENWRAGGEEGLIVGGGKA